MILNLPSMKEKLTELFKQMDVKVFEELFVPELQGLSAKANEIIQSSGSTQPFVFVVVKGLIRAFDHDDKGNEVNIMFFDEYMAVANLDAIIYQKKFSYHLAAIEETDYYRIDYHVLMNLAKNHHVVSQILNLILFQNLGPLAWRIQTLMMLDKEALYLKVMEDIPELVQRIPLLHLASYLGITPVSLSRIRGRLVQMQKSKPK